MLILNRENAKRVTPISMLNWWWNRDRVLTHLHLTPLSWTSWDRDIIVAQSQSYISIIARAAKAKRRRKKCYKSDGIFLCAVSIAFDEKEFGTAQKEDQTFASGFIVGGVEMKRNLCCKRRHRFQQLLHIFDFGLRARHRFTHSGAASLLRLPWIK